MNRAVVTAALDSIGRDTQTARLVAAKDYQGAYDWVAKRIEPHHWTTDAIVGGKHAIGDQQQRTNHPRAASYRSLRSELAKHLGIEEGFVMFYLFIGEDYYPDGGAKDFVAKGESLGGLLARAGSYPDEVDPDNNGWGMSGAFWQIANDDMVIVEQGDYPERTYAAKYPNPGIFAAATFASHITTIDPREHPLIEAQRDLGILDNEGKATP